MRKLRSYIAMLVVALFFLNACGDNPKSKTKAYMIGTRWETDGNIVCVNRVYYSDSYTDDELQITPEDQHTLLVVECTLVLTDGWDLSTCTVGVSEINAPQYSLSREPIAIAGGEEYALIFEIDQSESSRIAIDRFLMDMTLQSEKRGAHAYFCFH